MWIKYVDRKFTHNSHQFPPALDLCSHSPLWVGKSSFWDIGQFFWVKQSNFLKSNWTGWQDSAERDFFLHCMRCLVSSSEENINKTKNTHTVLAGTKFQYATDSPEPTSISAKCSKTFTAPIHSHHLARALDNGCVCVCLFLAHISPKTLNGCSKNKSNKKSHRQCLLRPSTTISCERSDLISRSCWWVEWNSEPKRVGVCGVWCKRVRKFITTRLVLRCKYFALALRELAPAKRLAQPSRTKSYQVMVRQ